MTATINRYLEGFASALAVGPRRRRRVIQEAEDHLRDAAEALEAKGVPPVEAEEEAVRRFGTPAAAAGAFGSTLSGRLWRTGSRWHRRRSERRSPAQAVQGPRQPPPFASPVWCDVCGGDVGPDEGFTATITAVIDIDSLVTLVAHASCYDLGESILALRGVPVTASLAPTPPSA